MELKTKKIWEVAIIEYYNQLIICQTKAIHFADVVKQFLSRNFVI